MKKTLTSIVSLSVLVSASSAANFYGVTAANNLIRFTDTNFAAPSSSVGITGLVASDGVTPDAFAQILNLGYSDTGTLYGLDSNANFYSLNGSSGAATLLGNTFAPFGFDLGFAYDPFSFGFRVVSDSAENYLIGTDGSVSMGSDTFYGAFDANEFAATVFTALGIDPIFGEAFAIDPDLDVLAQTFDPNFEEFFTVGDLGVDITGYTSLTIDEDGVLFAALSEDGLTSALFTIDSGTGLATEVGDFGLGINALTAVPEPSAYAAIFGLFSIGMAAFRRRRSAS